MLCRHFLRPGKRKLFRLGGRNVPRHERGHIARERIVIDRVEKRSGLFVFFLKLRAFYAHIAKRLKPVGRRIVELFYSLRRHKREYLIVLHLWHLAINAVQIFKERVHGLLARKHICKIPPDEPFARKHLILDDAVIKVGRLAHRVDVREQYLVVLGF